MKKNEKNTVCKYLLGLIFGIVMLTIPNSVSVSANGVSDAIQRLVTVYPNSCSYFTSDGKIDSNNDDSRCSLINIPARGGLPSGQTVKNSYGKSCWSCHAFAEYAWYVIYGHCTNTQVKTISTSELRIGDFIRFTGHSAIYLGEDSQYYYVYDSNWASSTDNKVRYNHTIKKTRGIEYCYRATNYNEIANVTPEPSGNSPIGHLDSVFADMGKITIRGWAADMDVPNEPIDVHVYAIQDGVRNGIGVLKADNYRPDVHMQNTGINEYHGFEATINTELTGNVEIEVYGINVGSGENSMLEDSPQTVVVPRDTIQPTISNVEVKDLSASGYTVTCNIEDNVEISRVRFATWTEENEQDDIVWKDETLSGSTISYKVDISEHNNENNCVYFTHIYAYDLAGNSTGYPVTVYVDAEPPVISDVEVSEVSASGYTIKCKIEDNVEISRVRFATWTEENEQDDIVWKDETLSGSTISYKVDISEHNNENNCVYFTHIYAYDLSENGAGYPVSVYIDGKAPVVSNVEITDISQKGYTVKCSVEDDYSGVNRVQFPTWYENDNPYGNDNSWNVSSSCSGKLEDGKYVYHVRVSDYDNQLGVYNTHIYAWDEHGNRSECYPLEITVNKDHEHNYVSTIKKKATCTESGIMLYTCKDDDDSYEKEIPATGHQNTEVRNVKEATCAEEGYTGDTYCKDCGTKLSTGEKIAKKEHTWDSGKVTQEASCIKTGIRTYTCTTCQSTKTEGIPATGKHENTEVRNVKEATCAEEGYTGDTYCKDCGTKLSTGEKIAKKAHIWDSGRVTQEATCTKTGTKTYICTTCQSTRTEEIPATGHVNKITKFAKEATCKSEGYTGDIYCKDCGELLEEGDILPKEEHVWDEGKITQQPGCTKSGERTYTCTTCQTTKTEEIPATGKHEKIEVRNAKEATCAEEGYTGDTYCRDCGTKLFTGEKIAKKAHTWDSGKVTQEATCTKTGIRTYTCTTCQSTKTEEVPVTGHVNKITKFAKEATCKSEGYTGDIYCKDCGELLEEGDILPKEEHVWDEGKITQQPGCTKSGERTYTCTTCQTTKTEEISATGHANKITKFAKKATCKTEGYTGDIYCQDCGELLEEGNVLPQEAHIWDEGKITKQPTSSAAGVRTYTCKNCGTTKTESIARLQPKKLTPGKVIKDKATNGVYKVLKDGVTVEFTKPVSRKTSVKIPDTVKLSEITCKVRGISANAFKNDTTLRTVTIGKNVTIIGSNAFYGARKLSKVSGGSAISKIGDKAFYNCSSLTGIELSKTVKYIGRQAFYNCKNLKTIIVKTSQLTSKNVGTKAFTGIYTKPIVKVPANKFKVYQKLLKSKGMSTKAIYKK